MYLVLHSNFHPLLLRSKEPMIGPFPEPHQSSTLFASQFFNSVPPSLLVPCEISVPFSFWDKSLYAFLISSMRATCCVLSHIYLITLFGKEYTLQSAPICIFLFLLLTSFSWSPNILCVIPFSYTINFLLLWIIWRDSHYKVINYVVSHTHTKLTM